MKKDDPVFPLVATTLFGLEDILADELKSLGAKSIRVMNRSVSFNGGRNMIYRANLWCRTAIRILRTIKTFRVSSDTGFYKNILDIDWSKFLSPDGTLAVDAVINNSVFDNSHYVAQRVKDAVVDRFRKETGRRPSVDLANPGLRINLYLKEDRAVLSLDSSGESLHRRGYRRETGEAPINEVLAAGILALTEWDMKSSLIDPMCGSGTFVIEAAMMARNIAPGLNRNSFGFMNWKDYDSTIFQKLYREAKVAILQDITAEIVGSDISRTGLTQARANARRAGVESCIKFEQETIENQNPPPPPGIMVANPPYGERMKRDDIIDLYSLIGDALKKKYNGFNAFVFTGNLEAAKNIGLRTSRRIKLYNGPLESRLLKFEMYQGTKKNKPA